MAVTPLSCVVPQRFPAERQADRDGPRQAGQTGDAERDQGDSGGERLVASQRAPCCPAAQSVTRVTRLPFQVMDGRKPTGGRVEVKVRLREPLSGQDTQTSTERWLVIDRS